MTIKIPLEKVPLEKMSISFTWDDNSVRHISIIAPLFIESGFRSTFYVVPGDPKFDSLYALGYVELQKKGFEIGSHSYTHKYMTSLSKEHVEYELTKSAQKLHQIMNFYPLTFAFPNHDYNDELINQARDYHLETRNTLANAVRFSIKTNTSLEDLIVSINESIYSKNNLVFSGHSIITDEEYLNKGKGEGYQPTRTSVLSGLIYYLKSVASKADVITFSKSALREWVKRTADFQNNEWVISSGDLQGLKKFHITQENIMSLL